MEKRLFVTVALIIGLVLFGCSKGYESQKNADDLKIHLSVDRYPLTKSDNTLNLKITDSAGQPVRDAIVTVRYYMPPMPGMAPMDFITQAVLKGDNYSFSATIPMEGGWKAEVSVTRPGKSPAVVLFNLDAR